jgi:hypothetical protein
MQHHWVRQGICLHAPVTYVVSALDQQLVLSCIAHAQHELATRARPHSESLKSAPTIPDHMLTCHAADYDGVHVA